LKSDPRLVQTVAVSLIEQGLADRPLDIGAKLDKAEALDPVSDLEGLPESSSSRQRVNIASRTNTSSNERCPMLMSTSSLAVRRFQNLGTRRR
jgi:hypothetical protein